MACCSLWFKFIVAFKEIGYDVGIYNEDFECSNFMDFLNSYLKTIEEKVASDNHLYVDANLRKSKKLNNKGR